MNRIFYSLVACAGIMIPSMACAFQMFDTTHHALISTAVRIDSVISHNAWKERTLLPANQKKMESALRELIQQQNAAVSLAAPSGFTTWATIDDHQRVFVYLRPSLGHSNTDIFTEIEAPPLNLAPISYNVACPILSVWVPITDLDAVAALPGVGSIRLVTRPLTHSGPINSRGDTIMKAYQIRLEKANAWGQGITVGVLSDDCGSLEGLVEPREANGELPAAPNVNVSLDTYGGSSPPRTHEGLALMEIIHDVAPKASIAFAEGISNITDFCSNIGQLAADGCQVICDDITFLEEPYFEDGVVANMIEKVVAAKDVVYVTSAGNFARDVHSFAFHQLATPLSLSDDNSTDNYTVHDFGGGQPYDLIYIPAGAMFDLRLQWNDPFEAPTHFYNLFLLDDATKKIIYRTSSTNEALQTIIQTNTTSQGRYYDIVVESEQTSPQSPAPRMTLVVHSTNRLLPASYKNGVSSILGHAMAKDVITCGAVSAMGTSQVVAEIYSSLGPDTLTDGSIRAKPDVASLDQVSTSVPGFSVFSGSSAAAAHVAGLAAMVRSAKPSMSASQVRAAILFGANPPPLLSRERLGAGITDATRTIH